MPSKTHGAFEYVDYVLKCPVSISGEDMHVAHVNLFRALFGYLASVCKNLTLPWTPRYGVAPNKISLSKP